MEKQTAANLSTDAMFIRYINVVNRAVGTNRYKFPFKQLLSLGQKKIGGKEIGAVIYKADPKNPHDYFTVRFEGGTFIAQHGRKAPDLSWKIKEEHLRHVISSPDQYVENPVLLDLDWLVARLGLESS